MKTNQLLILLILSCISLNAVERPFFNMKKDILIAQFDCKPDPDDIHAQAALGSMLLHKDLKKVNYIAVLGAIGTQKGKYIDSSELMQKAFGKHFINAHEDWDIAVKNITKKAISILKKGGKVWVQEAGQSNITADWVTEVLTQLSAEIVKSNIIVVQHSKWNENNTEKQDLEFVKKSTTYFAIDDGNVAFGDGKKDRGIYDTPDYRVKSQNWFKELKNAKSKKIKKLWYKAHKIIDLKFPDGFKHEWSYIHYGGLDYSDCVENWWIFNIGELADTHEKFWGRYVLK